MTITGNTQVRANDARRAWNVRERRHMQIFLVSTDVRAHDDVLALITRGSRYLAKWDLALRWRRLARILAYTRTLRQHYRGENRRKLLAPGANERPSREGPFDDVRGDKRGSIMNSSSLHLRSPRIAKLPACNLTPMAIIPLIFRSKWVWLTEYPSNYWEELVGRTIRVIRCHWDVVDLTLIGDTP